MFGLGPPELAQPLPERVEQERPIGDGRHAKKAYPRQHLSRLLSDGSERRGEETYGEGSDERNTPDPHAATAVCWFNVAPILRQPSIAPANMKSFRSTRCMLPPWKVRLKVYA